MQGRESTAFRDRSRPNAELAQKPPPNPPPRERAEPTLDPDFSPRGSAVTASPREEEQWRHRRESGRGSRPAAKRGGLQATQAPHPPRETLRERRVPSRHRPERGPQPHAGRASALTEEREGKGRVSGRKPSEAVTCGAQGSSEASPWKEFPKLND